ncbi:unnamed protein product [Paramecium sonneborni]|uniref:Uncharacterized protein n=1 Tax=Paramecium sonneborni TaxID=65129 RepID=A0A8S1PAT2_9CILI|nr:unnamed protein product [Paramecium sonneborni]
MLHFMFFNQQIISFLSKFIQSQKYDQLKLDLIFYLLHFSIECVDFFG